VSIVLFTSVQPFLTLSVSQCSALMRRQPVLFVTRLELSGMAPESCHNNVSPETKEMKEQDTKGTHGSDWLDSWKGPISASQWSGPSYFGSFALTSASSTYRILSGQTRQTGRETSYSQHYLQIRPPKWLTRKVWDIIAMSSYSGFKVHIRTYSVVHCSAPVFEYARQGDIDGLLDLFDKQLASPFDRDQWGGTLIQV
jgi:hypothetical protein